MNRGYVACVVVAGLAAAGQAQVQIVNNLPGSFTDISATGTYYNLGDDSTQTLTTAVGNAAFPAGSITIANNGFVGWLAGGMGNFSNTSLPAAVNAGAPSLFVLWDDLITNADQAPPGVYVKEDPGVLTIQWHQLQHFSSSPSTVTFQMKVFGSGPILAQMLYQDVNFGNTSYDAGASATVGYQDGAGGAVQWSFNQPVIADGTVLSVVPVPAPGAAAVLGLGGVMLRRRRR
jgi:hypothetical protein